MNEQEIKSLIEAEIMDAEVEIIDTKGTGSHFTARVIAPLFRNLSLLDQHQLVYKAVGVYMKKEIHALSIKTFSPEEWETQKQPEV